MKLVGGGSVINGATPSSLIYILLTELMEITNIWTGPTPSSRMSNETAELSIVFRDVHSPLKGVWNDTRNCLRHALSPLCNNESL